MLYLIDTIYNRYIELLSKLVQLESKTFEQNLSVFFLIMHVLLYLSNVRFEMLDVSYSIVEK